MKSCSFFGHRKILVNDKLIAKLYGIIEKIINLGVTKFIFGSKSMFDNLCYSIVSKLKEKYNYIERIAFDCPSEYSFTSIEEKLRAEKIHFNLTKEKVCYAKYEKSFLSPKLKKGTKYTYIIRNEEMINYSDICIFYYDKKYIPTNKKICKNEVIEYQSKSGTEIAFNYAKKKNKILINVFEK